MLLIRKVKKKNIFNHMQSIYVSPAFIIDQSHHLENSAIHQSQNIGMWHPWKQKKKHQNHVEETLVLRASKDQQNS